MTPALLALLISAIEEAIKIEPALAAEIRALFAKENPTPQDWLDLRARVLGESFAALAPNAAANLEPETVTAPAVAAPVVSQTDAAAEAASHTRADGTSVQVFN